MTKKDMNVKLVHIGQRFYTESGSHMSSLYREEGPGEYTRYDYGLMRTGLDMGVRITIRQATPAELGYFESRLKEIKEENNAL